MLKTMRRVIVSAVLPALLWGCAAGQPAEDPSLIGTATLSLTGVPADGTCVVITAVGNRSVSRAFDVAAGSSQVLNLNGLPVGQVTFTAEAYGVKCSMRGGMAPNWVSEASFTVTVAVKPVALVTLNLVRNGMASVSVGFDDGPDGGAPTGGAGSTGGGGSTGAGGAAGGGGAAGSGPGSLTFMQVAGVTGPETAAGFEGWFDLDKVTISTTSSVSMAGGGGGAGKTTWAASAQLRLQQGVPDLYKLAVQGTHVQTVKFAVKTAGPPAFVVWKATLSEVIVSGVASNGSSQDVPVLTVTFVFAKIEIEFDPRNADGTPGPATIITWDIQRNTGGGSSVVPFDFVLGGPATPPAKAISAFRAPSEMTLTDPLGGGGGAGKPTFSNAAVTLPIDAAVLQYVLVEATGRVLPTGSVQIDTAGPSGPTLFGTYGFKNIVLDGMTLSGLDANVSFQAAAFSWAVGTTVVMFP